MMIRTAIVCVLALAPLDVPAQTPGRLGWGDLIGKSSSIVVGIVEGSFSVMREPRAPVASKQLPDGNVITDLPDVREMRLGVVLAVRAVEVIKKDGRVKPGNTVHLFIPSHPSEGAPVLLHKKRYLIFIEPMNPNNDAFTGAIVSRAHRGSATQAPFTPASHYVVVMGDNGVVPMTPRNSNAIPEVKARDLLTAVTDPTSGVLTWLKTQW